MVLTENINHSIDPLLTGIRNLMPPGVLGVHQRGIRRL